MPRPVARSQWRRSQSRVIVIAVLVVGVSIGYRLAGRIDDDGVGGSHCIVGLTEGGLRTARSMDWQGDGRSPAGLPMLVATDRLTKRYASFAALDGVSMTVGEGEILGLLGANGAGKTTLLRLLLGYIRPTSGAARVAGFDCVSQSLEVRHRTAALPGEARLFRRMNGHDILDYFSRLRHECRRADAARVAERLDLDCSRQVARMSTGMRQKLALVVVLATDAPLLILDEPTANLDPPARAGVLALVREARAAGRTIIFSSHVLSEVEETCDRAVILRKGRLVHEQSIEKLRRSHRITARLTGELGAVPAELARHVTVTAWDDGQVVLESGELTNLLGWLARLPLAEVRIEPIGLATVYKEFDLYGE